MFGHGVISEGMLTRRRQFSRGFVFGGIRRLIIQICATNFSAASRNCEMVRRVSTAGMHQAPQCLIHIRIRGLHRKPRYGLVVHAAREIRMKKGFQDNLGVCLSISILQLFLPPYTANDPHLLPPTGSPPTPLFQLIWFEWLIGRALCLHNV